MKGISFKHEIGYHVFFLILNALVIGLFYTLSWLDLANMRNNGYVSDQAVVFNVDESEAAIKLDRGTYILMQYDPNSPNIKRVWIDGNVKLPPIKKVHQFSSTDHFAIVGQDAALSALPSDYVLTGYFADSVTYKLSTDMWLISTNKEIDLNFGTQFIFNTPVFDKENELRRIFHINGINRVDHESAGTYNLKSNRSLILSIKIALVFIGITFVIGHTFWLVKDRYLINIAYLSGFLPSVIYYKIFTYKILPYVCSCIFLFIGCLFLQHSPISLWSYGWVVSSLITMLGFIIYSSLLLLFLVRIYTIKKGGGKY